MIKDKRKFFLKRLLVVAMLFVLMSKGAVAKTGGAASETEAKANAAETYGKLPLLFIQNNGQMDKSVRFYERGAGHATFFTEQGVYISLRRVKEKEGEAQNKKGEREYLPLKNLCSQVLNPAWRSSSPFMQTQALR